MGAVTVNQILVTPLSRIALTGGDVFHAMKFEDPGFVNFGEAYFSQIKINAIKAWKKHLRMTLNLVVPVGLIQFVFIDDMGGVRQEMVGLDRYVRLTIPPGIWFGFRGLAPSYSLLMNIADIPHDPLEIERKDVGDFSFNWSLAE
jgi:dTDP-4-dehydrorhamnose 3,5-epimerase